MADYVPKKENSGLDKLSKGLQFDRTNIPPNVVPTPVPRPEVDVKKELHKGTNDEIRPIRTYAGDVQEAIDKGHESVVSIQIKAQEKRIKDGDYIDSASGQKTKWALLATLGIFFILAGATILAVFLYKDFGEKTIPLPVPTGIIISDKNIELEGDSLNAESLGQAIKTEMENASETAEITNIEIKKSVGGISTRNLSITEFLIFINSEAPASFTRSLDNEYMLGIYRREDNAYPFLILKTNAFNVGFAGMLEWEKTIPKVFYPIFYGNNFSGNVNFTDIIIRNQDVRSLASGEMMYSFLDPQTIIITTEGRAFEELVTKFIATRGLRN